MSVFMSPNLDSWHQGKDQQRMMMILENPATVVRDTIELNFKYSHLPNSRRGSLKIYFFKSTPSRHDSLGVASIFFTKIPPSRQKGSESDIAFTFFNAMDHYQSLLLYSKNKCICWEWQIPYKCHRMACVVKDFNLFIEDICHPFSLGRDLWVYC